MKSLMKVLLYKMNHNKTKRKIIIHKIINNKNNKKLIYLNQTIMNDNNYNYINIE